MFYALALFAVYVSFKKIPGSGKVIAMILSWFWFWMGAVYHILFFSGINKAAYLFGAVFIVQSILLFYTGVYKDNFSFKYDNSARGVSGLIIIIYSLFLYPFIGFFAGNVYPFSPTFGLPCPTTIFTFGLLLWNRKADQWPVIGIPLIWSIAGSAAVLKFGIIEDTGLIAAAILTLILLVKTHKKDKNHLVI